MEERGAVAIVPGCAGRRTSPAAASDESMSSRLSHSSPIGVSNEKIWVSVPSLVRFRIQLYKADWALIRLPPCDLISLFGASPG